MFSRAAASSARDRILKDVVRKTAIFDQHPGVRHNETRQSARERLED